jgi:hypothetical protein
MPSLAIIRNISDFPAAIAQTLRELTDTLDYVSGNMGDPSFGDSVARAIRDLRVSLVYSSSRTFSNFLIL